MTSLVMHICINTYIVTHSFWGVPRRDDKNMDGAVVSMYDRKAKVKQKHL